jgi:PAS domain S-box-containing protein
MVEDAYNASAVPFVGGETSTSTAPRWSDGVSSESTGKPTSRPAPSPTSGAPSADESLELAVLRVAFEAAQLGWFEHDLDADRMTFSDQLTTIFGKTPEEFGGTLDGFYCCIHPDDRISCMGKIAEAIYNQGRYTFEARILRPDGAVRWTYVAGQVVREEGAPGRMVGVALDVTDRKRMEEALRTADRQKDDFLAMLGHELRNPMTPIRTAVEYLRRTGAVSEIGIPHLDVISRQVEHMVRLVDDLLDVSRITRGKIILSRKPVSLGDVVATALESARPVIESRGHRLNVVVPERPPWVEGDLTRLAQVLLNLLDNAAKYTDAGGRIELLVAEEVHDAVLRVRDSGVGISPEVLPNVFELFTQADATLDRARGGLGLGLTLVRRLTEMHGGTVSVASLGLGQGSEFAVRLPKIVPGAGESAASVALGSTTAAAARRILIIDDNQDAADSLGRLMELQQHEVMTAYDGASGLTMMESFNPEVVLLDIGLPGMNGYEVAKEARRLLGKTPFLVALTGYGSGDVRQRCWEAGFDAHLVKPAELDALDELVANYDPDRAD